MVKPDTYDVWRNEVSVKLDKRNAERHLQQWLEGGDLPPIDRYTEGHTWLLEAVKDIPHLKGRLATLAAILIENYLGHRLRSEDMPRLIFNLLYFCAQLQQPMILKKPLLQMLNDRAVPANGEDSGEYQGVPLIAALRAALAGNQTESEMLPLWQAMLEGKSDSYLNGTPMDGFEGVIGLGGSPKEVLVGWALARMADYLDDNPFRTRQFKQLLRVVRSRFVDYPWDFELLAARCEWRPWAQKLVGSPKNLIRIEYAKIAKVEYLKGRTRPKIRIRLPLHYKVDAAQLELRIRQLALDFCKEPPADGTLVPLIEHLLPCDKDLLRENGVAAAASSQRKRTASSDFGPVVQSLRKNEAA